MEKNRNYFVAIALSVLILVAWQFLYVNPKLEKDRAALEAQQAAQQSQQTTTTSGGTTTTATGTSGTLPGSTAATTTTETRETALAKSARIEIDTPSLSGSISLTGARFDDLKLKEFHETVDKTSPIITLLSPAETEHGYFAEIGYVGSEATGQVPGPQTVWTQDGTGKLTQTTPVKLTYTNDKNVTFTRTIAVDEHYMFTITDSIENRTDAAIALSPYGRSTRFFKPTDPSVYVLHEGFIGVLGDLGLHEVKYSETEEDTTVAPGKATGGWLGITDKYWATALVPPQATPYETRFSYFQDGRPRYQADYRQDDITIAPGQSIEVKNLFFGGAKEVPIIDQYEASYSIPRFDLMIDWGWFWFFTKPMFQMMDFFFRYFGNFGIAILITTIVVKGLFFPLANKQYASMANMKKMQPKMEELKAKHGDDRMALQQAMMQLYKEEKINPLAGCWPILLQIPVFFALYKVIYVTIEMRHAPFFGWIQDLSAPDPFYILPVVYAVTAWLQVKLSPTPITDPVQAKIFQIMPIAFSVLFIFFPSGLVLYWLVNNVLQIGQQWQVNRMLEKEQALAAAKRR